MNYILIDFANMYSRSRFVVRGDIDTKIGMAVHITLASIRKAWNDFDCDHVVFCTEGRSWRKDFYPPYKRNRKEAKGKLSPRDLEEDKVFWEVFGELCEYFQEKTNCTVLQNDVLEADDLIAGFIQNHPNDNHVIVSTDGDFAQLVSDNVKIYNGVSEITTTINGYYDAKGKPVLDKKTKEPKPAPDPEWLLFEKCIRGDTSDNVFSAYPGVRKKSSKNKVGLFEAFADKKDKGYNWNNLMLQRWTDHHDEEHRVIDDYNRNVVLCDLTAQPTEIRAIIDDTTSDIEPKKVQGVGIHFMKFCNTWRLNRISDDAQTFGRILGASYPGGQR